MLSVFMLSEKKYTLVHSNFVGPIIKFRPIRYFMVSDFILKGFDCNLPDNIEEQVIRVKKLMGLPPPALELLASYPVNKRILCTYELNYSIPKI